MSREGETEVQDIKIQLAEGHMLSGGVAVIETIDGEGNRRLTTSSFGVTQAWSRIGLLQAALDKEKNNVARMWS